MRNIIINSDETLRIDGFEILKYKKVKNSYFENDFIKKLLKMDTVVENIRINGCYYIAESNEYVIFAFLAEIGKFEHPLIGYSHVSTWYNSNIGGVYLVGFDKVKQEFFAPILKRMSAEG